MDGIVQIVNRVMALQLQDEGSYNSSVEINLETRSVIIINYNYVTEIEEKARRDIELYMYISTQKQEGGA